MKILDLQTGKVHEYGTSGHDSLHVSMDGRYLTYENLQNGDGSGLGDYRFVCDDNKIPQESGTAEAMHADVYFNIGGFEERRHGEWEHHNAYYKRCSICQKIVGFDYILQNGEIYNFCPNCGAEMRER